MKLNRSKAFFSFCLVTFLLLLAANHSSAPQKSIEELAFESWLQQRDSEFSQADSPNTVNPAISLHLFSNDQTKGPNFLLSTGDFPDAHERIFRILNILEESNTFSTSKWYQDNPNYLSLVIENGAQTFKTSLPFPKEESDVKLRTMLKLFQLYAMERETKRSELAKNQDQNLEAD